MQKKTFFFFLKLIRIHLCTSAPCLLKQSGICSFENVILKFCSVHWFILDLQRFSDEFWGKGILVLVIPEKVARWLKKKKVPSEILFFSFLVIRIYQHLAF